MPTEPGRSGRPAIGPAALLLALALAPGCGGDDGPKVVPVSGKATLDGQPAEGVELTFVPDPTNPAVTPGAAITDAQGAFAASYRDKDGLAPGKYRILAVKRTTADGKTIPDVFLADPSMAAMSGLMKDILPAKYGNANSTDLALDVPEAGTSTAEVPLKSASAAKKKAR